MAKRTATDTDVPFNEDPGSPALVPHKNVDEAILAILQEGDLYIQKLKKNQGVGYKYASEGDYLERMRPKLAEHGMICTPAYRVVDSSITVVKPPEGKDSAKILRLVVIEGTFTWTHIPSGTSRVTVSIGEGADNQDKASYKAMTGAQKYAIKQAFWIETGDDPEKDDEKPEPRVTQPPATTLSRFEQDLQTEMDRVGPPLYTKYVLRWKTDNGLDIPEGYDLTNLSGENKRSLVAFLRAQPPF